MTAAEGTPTCLCSSNARADPLLDKIPLKLGQRRHDRGHHLTLRGRQIELQSRLCDQRYVPGLERLQRMHKVNGTATPARELGHEYRIDLPSLSQGHDPLPFGAIQLYTGSGLFPYADDLIAGACRVSQQIMLLPLARLVGGRYTAIDHCLLSQLNPFG